MQPSTARDDSPLLDSHEERLKVLEENRSDVASQLAAQTVQIRYLGQAIEEGLAEVGKKLEGFAAPISKQVQEVVATVEGLQTAETARKARRDERSAFMKKVGGAIALAAAGILGKEVAVLIWHHLS